MTAGKHALTTWSDGERTGTRIHPLYILPVIIFVAFRKLVYTAGYPQFWLAAALLGGFTLCFLGQLILASRTGRFQWLYFLVQMGFVQALGLIAPYEDTWGLLYVVIGVQLRYLPVRQAGAWAAAFTIALLVTMIATQGLLAGLGFALLVFALTVFFALYDLHYDRAQTARQESQRLLEELQAAHRRLKEYAVQAEDLAAAQERERLMRELHDSVGQMVFSISLTAESTRLLLDENPAQVPAALESLQELTGRALSQMRALINQWRPQ